ncbi:MAG: nitroreductase family protein [Clostridia bacterium]|nr:nitroreductase family protein [Clostridia bacterium]
MSDLFEVIESRRSIREYSSESIPKKHIEEMIRAATWAPSANNRQMWKFIVVTNEEVKNRMVEAVSEKIDKMAEEFGLHENVDQRKAFGTFFKNAPVVIVVLHEPYKNRWEEAARGKGWTEEKIRRMRPEPGLQSIGAAIQNLLLAAEALGYGSCWMTLPAIAAYEIEEILNVKPPWELAAVIPVGKPAKIPEPKPRKPIEETLEFVE